MKKDSKKVIEKKKGGLRDGAPEWAVLPFEKFLDDLDRLSSMVELSVRGIAVLQGMPELFKAISRAKSPTKSVVDEDKSKTTLEKMSRLATLAENEKKDGYPLVYAQATIGLWSSLEYILKEFVAEWLRHHRKVLTSDAFVKIKVPLIELEALRGVNKYRYLTSLIEKEVGAGIRNGVDRFESLLKPLGLSGAVPKDVARDLFELAQVRNALAHFGNNADLVLKKACPWLKIGKKKFVVTAEMLHRYHMATSCYIMIIICRVGDAYNIDMNDHHSAALDAYKLSKKAPK